MELRDFFTIFIRYWRVGVTMVACTTLASVAFFFVQPQTYETFLQLNITRAHGELTHHEYTYDHFYRLQADERFADTIVQWIKSPVIQNKLFVKNGKISAKRLSSQVIAVTYKTDSVDDARIIADRLTQILGDMTEKLNERQDQDNWFLVLEEDPIINDGMHSLILVTSVGFIIGLFSAFWGILAYHYMRGQ